MFKTIIVAFACLPLVASSLPAVAATAANSQTGANKANPNTDPMAMPMKMHKHKKHMKKM